MTLTSIATKAVTTLSIKSSTIVATPGSANQQIGNGTQAAGTLTNGPTPAGGTVIVNGGAIQLAPLQNIDGRVQIQYGELKGEMVAPPPSAPQPMQ